MRRLLFFICTLVACASSAQQIAITLDDLPFGYAAGMSEREKVEAFDKILGTLKKYKVKATLLVTTGNLSEETRVILDKAVKAGHQLGNHTHRHYDLNRVSAATYIADIDSCEAIAGSWLNSNYFRYAMLHRGDTKAKLDSVKTYLQNKGYVIAPVTIDNNEWVYNRGYSLAMMVNDQKKMDQVGKEYIYHMQEVTRRYQKLSLQLTSREIPQILLLHANPINAQYLDKLLGWYKREGWKFITLDEALKDDFYKLEDDYVGPYGFSQLDRIKWSRTEK